MRPAVVTIGPSAEDYVALALELHRKSGGQKRNYKVDDALILVQPQRVIIMVEGHGFLFHPRSDSFPNGLDPSGAPLPDGPYVYPLIDNDHGTRSLSDEDGTWDFTADPPENYGNVVWTDGGDRILTWKGPPSFALDPEVQFSGLTTLDEDLITTTYYTPFAAAIYEGGAAMATPPGRVLGAAVNKTTGLLLAVLWNNYRDIVNPEGGTGGHYFEAWVKRDEWVRIGFVSGFRPSMPWYFNASGTESQAVDGGRFKVVFGEDLLSAVFTQTGLALATLAQRETSSSADISTTPDNGADLSFSHLLPLPSDIGAWVDTYSGSQGADTKTWTRTGEVVIDVRYDGDEEVVTSVKIESTNVSHTEYLHKDNIYGLAADIYSFDGSNPWDPPLNINLPRGSSRPQVGDLITNTACKGVWTLSGITLDADGFVTWVGNCDIVITAAEPCTGRSISASFMSSPLTIIGPSAPHDGDAYSVNPSTQGPYVWSISKGSITEDGVVTVTGQCGTAVVTVTDACGHTATMTVSMPIGVWVVVSQDESVGQCTGYGAGSCTYYPDTGTTLSGAPILDRTKGTTCTALFYAEWREGFPCPGLFDGPHLCMPGEHQISGLNFNWKAYKVTTYQWSCP